jgi:leucyl/phenylalanyl-tRNA--protein transferase
MGKAIEQTFSPEFQNRIDKIIKFKHLEKSSVISIVKKEIKEFSKVLLKKGINLEVTILAISWFAEKGFSKKFGAREISRIIQNQLKNLLVDRVLFGDLKNGGNIKISIKNGNIEIIKEKKMLLPPKLTNNPKIFPNPLEINFDGIVAFGGDLSPQRLISAYSQGIFPWYNENEPILWWSPNPRFVILPQTLHISKKMKKIIKRNLFKITFNLKFPEVINNCKKISRKNQNGTWITNEMENAYNNLYKLGYAFSVEAWQNNNLAGGFYGIKLGNIFFGESMFSLIPNASKVAFLTFALDFFKNNGKLIDSQVYTTHMESLGGIHISLKDFLEIIKKESINFQNFENINKNK